MEQLSETISTLLDIPELESGDAVLDGCFFLTPYITSSLKGNGAVQDKSLHLTMDAFYTSKTDIVDSANLVIANLGLNSRYICTDPSYTYNQEAELWQFTINIIIIGGLST